MARTHGKRSTYAAGCRCRRCTRANREECRRYEAKRKAEGRPIVRQPTPSKATGRRAELDAALVDDMLAIAAVAGYEDSERILAEKMGGPAAGWHNVKIHRRIARMRREIGDDLRRPAGSPMVHATAGAAALRWALRVAAAQSSLCPSSTTAETRSTSQP